MKLLTGKCTSSPLCLLAGGSTDVMAGAHATIWDPDTLSGMEVLHGATVRCEPRSLTLWTFPTLFLICKSDKPLYAQHTPHLLSCLPQPNLVLSSSLMSIKLMRY